MLDSFVCIIILCILIVGFIKKVPLFETFVEGAKEGIQALFSILAPLIAILSAISVLRASGVLLWFCNALSPFFAFLGIPRELIPAVLLRPLSGSGSIALLSDIFAQYGPDSYIGKTASVLMASTETTLYVAALYFGVIHHKKSARIIAIALLTDLFAAILASLIMKIR